MSTTFEPATVTKTKITSKRYQHETHGFRNKVLNLKEYEQKIGGDLICISDPGRPVLSVPYDNGLVGTIFTCYNNHHAIVLRPDDFWCSIMTQFSAYVNKNSEELRSKIVNFDGKKELSVYFDQGLTIHEIPYKDLVVEISNEIAKNINDPSVKDWALAKFTTTTDDDTVVYSAVLMATMSKYFDYKMCECCGLPSVTLLGTVDDYGELRKKLDKLVEFDTDEKLMTKWYNLLIPVFDELINSVMGNPDKSFWNKVCSRKDCGSGKSYLSGWLSYFCVFDNDGKWQYVERDGAPMVDINNIPTGIITVPVKLEFVNGVTYDTMILAGSFCVEKLDAYTMKPRIDFAMGMIDGAKFDTGIDRSDGEDYMVAYRRHEQKELEKFKQKIVKRSEWLTQRYIDTFSRDDLYKLYSRMMECDGSKDDLKKVSSDV